jgi:hypothetical protein
MNVCAQRRLNRFYALSNTQTRALKIVLGLLFQSFYLVSVKNAECVGWSIHLLRNIFERESIVVFNSDDAFWTLALFHDAYIRLVAPS